MTLPSVIRIFFAIDVPEDIKKSIGIFISTLKKKSKSNAIRWITPKNLHITLHFLAEVRSDDLNDLIKNVKEAISEDLVKTSLKFEGIHLFPNPYRPRVIVLDIMPQEQIAKLAQFVGRGIEATHYPIDTRPFRAHLTLGRIKHSQGVNLNFLSQFNIHNKEVMDVNEIVLFRSEPVAHGSKYTVLTKIALNEQIPLHQRLN